MNFVDLWKACVKVGQQFYQMQLHASGVDGHPENSVLQELNILLIETFDMYR